MNIFIKYLYIVIIFALIVVLVFFIKELTNFINNLSKIDTSKLTKNIETVNEKLDDIEETKNSWKFFIKIYIAYYIVKEFIEDLKKGSKKVVAASLTKTAIKSANKIRKI